MHAARELWMRFEAIHAITYFAPEPIEAARQIGLKGFWMGYFGFRAAPLGAVSPGTAEAAFANFAGPMVERSIPDAWVYATPAAIIEARAGAAGHALRRLVPRASDEEAVRLANALEAIADHAEPIGRPMFAANRDLVLRTDPMERLWQACTTLREHRGDGHVAALTVHGIDGCEAHHLHAAAHGTPHEVLRDNRGFTFDQWANAGRRLEERGLTSNGELTEPGAELTAKIETLTDELAGGPIRHSAIDVQALVADLDPWARTIAASGVLPFPNPMGLPPEGEAQASR